MPAGQIKRQLKFFCQKQHWFQSQFTFEGHLTPSLFILLYKQNNSKESPKYHSNFQQKKITFENFRSQMCVHVPFYANVPK